MKIYKLPELSDSDYKGEFTLDLSKETGLYTTYLRFREKGEKKNIDPSEGFNALVHVIKGSLQVKKGRDTFPVSAGEAFKVEGTDFIIAENLSDAESILLITCGAAEAGAVREKDEVPIENGHDSSNEVNDKEVFKDEASDQESAEADYDHSEYIEDEPTPAFTDDDDDTYEEAINDIDDV